MARGLQRKLRDMELAFKEVDSDNSGTISHQEFIQLLRKLGLVRVCIDHFYSTVYELFIYVWNRCRIAD